MTEIRIPFNKPWMTGRELEYISRANAMGQLSGNGAFTGMCHLWLEKTTGARKALLTHSCTGALEMTALAADIRHGDEIIMPSYTFVSTANAFALRGGVPVFIDIRPDTLNMDENLVEEAVTARTKAIVPVHYAGVGCEMDVIMALAGRLGLMVIEDAAQALMSSYRGRPLGSIGHMGALSFHETKNVICGEGGALLINRDELIDRSEIIWQKGTDRNRFYRGEVDKYTWQGLGSSFLPNEITAAFLLAQLEHAENLVSTRRASWELYHMLLAEPEKQGLLKRPVIPTDCTHNAHMYYVILPEPAIRHQVIKHLSTQGIHAVFHYVPLHSSPAGVRYGRACGDLKVTTAVSERILRLPLWAGISEGEINQVCDALISGLELATAY
ncbi:MAG: dTDP-4-amino-4,6-dideoxygalactose transaminase [Desulfobacteraceae bacterium]|jgi:dTDP-4-amino-4,6-dideoxygalactose transaminase|nr:MAG: dTDP-4-amino-4,6-dideoxygalactose transaminase [Desulfobacteraceae bacterium]